MSKEAMTLALELFEQFGRDSRLKYEHQAIYKTIVALKEALAKQEQFDLNEDLKAWQKDGSPIPAKQEQGEPVAWGMEGKDGFIFDVICPAEHDREEGGYTTPLYTTPQPAPQGEAAPVAENKGGRIKWLIDDWPQNCLLYTHPPKSFTYEQVKAHIRAASMSANDIVVGSDVTNDGVSVVIRRRDEVLYAEFFATPQPAQKPWVGLTDEERDDILDIYITAEGRARAIEAKLKEKNT